MVNQYGGKLVNQYLSIELTSIQWVVVSFLMVNQRGGELVNQYRSNS